MTICCIRYQISVNLMEIYNEKVVDLLHPGGRAASGSNGLEIRRGPGGVFIPVKLTRPAHSDFFYILPYPYVAFANAYLIKVP